SLITMKTLNSICEEYQVPEIQFLKIDVEGAEYLVLQGLDLNKLRPWIILIEATIPSSQKENYFEWEPLLKNNSYRFVYFDGLNRFYVANEHSSLSDLLSIPPNVFDGFITKDNLSNTKELTNANSNLAQVQSDRDRIQAELNAIQSDRDLIQVELNGIRSNIDQMQAELYSVQSERDRIQVEFNAIQFDRDRIQAELNGVQFDKDRMQAELNAVQLERDRIHNELISVQSDRDLIHAKLISVQSDRDLFHAKLNSVQSDRDRMQAELNALQVEKNQFQVKISRVQTDKDRIQAELNAVQSDRDRISAELFNAYNSKSFRLTKPLREVAWFFRRLPGNYQKAKTSTRLLAFSTIHSLRMFPLLSPLANSIKQSNPELWSRMRSKILGIHTPPDIEKHPTSLSSSELSEEEQYFLDLFQHEIEKRKNTDGD
ncbi:MAG: FkbM family methyltransferase, partial [Candidatus Helarchaeota archaeon]|nr:FkbM family methyltransferase [Candidatus Helarchaeota archaeon]